MMNKIKKVIQIIPTLDLGGAEIMIENLSSALKDENIEVKVVSLYNKNTAISKRLKHKGITVIFLDKKKGFDWKIIYNLYKLFQTEKPDVIHTHLYATTYVVAAAFLSRTKNVVHTIHSMANKETGTVNKKIYKFYYRFCSLRPVAISKRVKESFQVEYKLNDLNVSIVNNGIDLNKCIKKENTDKMLNPINIIHVGNFKEAKNHNGLIESFNIIHLENPNTILTLVGVGILEKSIKEKVKEYKLAESVVFLGSKENIFPYLNKADIFILPSLWEGMPMSLIEAMGTGLPIVATKVGGIPDMINNRVTGLLVNVDTNEIAQATLELINNNQLRKILGINAKDASENFSSNVMVKEYLKVYNNI